MHQAELHFPREIQLLCFKAFVETHLSFFKFKAAQAQIFIVSLLWLIGLFMTIFLFKTRGIICLLSSSPLQDTQADGKWPYTDAHPTLTTSFVPLHER